MSLLVDVPTSGRWIGVMRKPAQFPPGHVDITALECAIIACEWVGQWQWTSLDPDTKQQIGEYMVDSDCDFHVWYYLVLIDKGVTS